MLEPCFMFEITELEAPSQMEAKKVQGSTLMIKKEYVSKENKFSRYKDVLNDGTPQRFQMSQNKTDIATRVRFLKFLTGSPIKCQPKLITIKN